MSCLLLVELGAELEVEALIGPDKDGRAVRRGPKEARGKTKEAGCRGDVVLAEIFTHLLVP